MTGGKSKKEWTAVGAARAAQEARIATVEFHRQAPIARTWQAQKMLAAFQLKVAHLGTQAGAKAAQSAATTLLFTGMEVSYDGPDGALITADGRSVMFEQISDYNPPRWPDPAHPQQAHVDLLVEDLDTGEERVLELGASRLNPGGERFRVFADPAGHPFCLIR